MQVLILIVIFLALGLFILIAQEIHERKRGKNTDENVVSAPQKTDDGECCGQHLVCERDSLLNHSTEIEYYDDEELDALAGIAAVNYTPEQVSAISEVFFTLQEKDVAGWVRSLQMRNIDLPDEVKEEALLIVSERRQKH